ncbi:hypothetical protein EDC14_101277 [Hydrogenispora ethanolica]|uniref:Uncharacterized protein n=1 Tax=Hydrogenispora ethanolica TaxID=1082276 RepID=A0A4R1RTI3_HYDET|nr:hypothetical protein EDC14_101277 [Hydrogenispora ethanolica]
MVRQILWTVIRSIRRVRPTYRRIVRTLWMIVKTLRKGYRAFRKHFGATIKEILEERRLYETRAIIDHPNS